MFNTDISKEDLTELLKPGYASVETGYRTLPNGDVFVKALIRMSYCRGNMVDWWFGYIQDTPTYKIWHPSHQYFKWDEKWQPGHYIGASHWTKEYLGKQLVTMRIQFNDPSEIYDIAEFPKANISCMVYARIFDEEGKPFGHFLHALRDTDFGCEMRNRFWIYQASEAIGKGLLTHSLEEMGNLAEFLPGLHSRFNGMTNI